MNETQLRGRAWYIRYSASLVLVTLFLASWVGQLVTQWHVVQDEAAQHGERAVGFWTGDFWWAFGASTLENWQSEFLQLAVQVALLAVAYHLGSSQSREGDVDMQESLARIEAKLDQLF